MQAEARAREDLHARWQVVTAAQQLQDARMQDLAGHQRQASQQQLRQTSEDLEAARLDLQVGNVVASHAVQQRRLRMEKGTYSSSCTTGMQARCCRHASA